MPQLGVRRFERPLPVPQKLDRSLGFCCMLLVTVLAAAGCGDSSKQPASAFVEQLIGKKPLDPVPVGVLFSQTGSMSISETQLKHAVVQAIDEINAAGGVLGRKLLPVIEDGRTREDIFEKRAEELIEDHKVPVIFGGWRSVDRKAILPIVERADSLLFYPLQYEGNESSKNIFYGGLTPNQQILPALDWFMSSAGGNRSRVYLIGSDYVFPRTANYIVRRYLEGKGMQVVGESYVPFDQEDFATQYRAILESKADLILSTINGQSNIAFFREYVLQGLAPEATPIFATSLGESGLRSIPASLTVGHYAAWSFFQSLESQPAQDFVRRFQTEYGSDRPVHDPMESAYSQVYLWREAVEKAGSFSAAEVRAVLEKEISFEGPAGLVKIDPRNHHTYKRLRIGRILADQQFEILYESPDLLPPEPYPGFAFPGWSCDWTAGGLQSGPPIDLEN